MGSNLGNRIKFLRKALHKLSLLPNTTIPALSDVFETEPMDLTEQPQFLNACVELKTSLLPDELLTAMLGIETQLGRRRTVPYGPRQIDLDLLLCGSEIINCPPRLLIPHPKLHERAFVLIPLAQIAPQTLHPTLHCTIAELCKSVPGREGVQWVPISLQSDCAPIENSNT